MRMPAASASGAMVRACWRTSSSVGAMIAAWPPASMTAAAASSATTVLPEPTSPWSRRSMRSLPARSASMSAIAACWLPVSWKGRAAISLARSLPSPLRAPPGAAPLVLAHQGQRELARQQFVVGEAGDVRRLRFEVGRGLRVVGVG